ncbi:hypothetical protein MMC22_004914 [Lobaria immixta]|nr:hypothetical protein [Lobaria immixta]
MEVFISISTPSYPFLLGTNRYEQMISTGKGLRAVARWVMSEGLLGQFLLAKEQSDWAEGRGKRGMGEDEGEDEGEDADSSDNE